MANIAANLGVMCT